MAEPASRFCLAFDDPTLTWAPTWTAIDDHPNLVTSYTIDRGRQYELDRTDTGRAVVSIADVDGILDPTNPGGPYSGLIEPLVQAAIARWDPVADEWFTRYRGFVEDYDYSFDPSQQVNRLTVSLVDLFEILAAIPMLPGRFGDDPTLATPAVPSAVGQVFFEEATMQDRIEQILTNAGIPSSFFVVFSGNVRVRRTIYSPGESAMTAIQEAADAEFPGVSNVYVDRLGRLAVHGREAKFDPAGVASGAGSAWDYHEFDAGDGETVYGGSGFAHIRRFAFNRGLSKVINQAYATPGLIDDGAGGLRPPTGDELLLQLVEDTVSIADRGVRGWEAQNLITIEGLASPGFDALEETRKFAEYYVANYSLPRNRVTEIGFRSMRPTEPHATANWRLLSLVDIALPITVTIASPGGGGFEAEAYFVEGVHEQVAALNANYDDVTLSLDLSPRAYFTDDPWNPGP